MADQVNTENPERAAGGGVQIELAKGLGLFEALAIGVGTMIGAGVFVLPGVIIGKTGPAAILSFLFGGVIALLTAMAAAEVATGMPKSGGGYYFISRALGPLWGDIIGWGSWFGLIFASAFYMVGFGEYLHTVTGIPTKVSAMAMTGLLVVLNLLGSNVAGKAQNVIVAVLLGVIVLFIGRGSFSLDTELVTSDFMPFGWGSVVAGTAMIFVTYCGYGEIASMAEEIKKPGRNLPRALLGSVIFVTVLYCVIMFVCSALRPREGLQSATVVADLAGDLMGGFGRTAILVGAILATVSSANASIMSASRISFAMGRDRLVWDWLNRVHPRFRVPDRAIWITGALTAGIVLLGDIELLAEAAGLLHLLLYGLISVACIILRGAKREAYKPQFKTPLYPIVPLLGAAGCGLVIGFMSPMTLLMGIIIIAFACGHYYLWGKRRTDLKGAWPYFLRHGMLEPALDQVERWGAEADERPTVAVAVAHPERQRARLRIAAALVGPARGRVLAVNVYRTEVWASMEEKQLEEYYSVVQEREAALEEVADSLRGYGAEAVSLVPVTASLFYGLVTSAQASHAALAMVGWPGEQRADQPAVDLVGSLDDHLRTHLLVLRETGAVPAQRIVAFPQENDGDLVIPVAARLANEWHAELTFAAWVPSGTGAEAIIDVEEELEQRAGDVARYGVRAVEAETYPDAILSEAHLADMIVAGCGMGEVSSLIRDVGDAGECSVVVARGAPGQPLRMRV